MMHRRAGAHPQQPSQQNGVGSSSTTTTATVTRAIPSGNGHVPSSSTVAYTSSAPRRRRRIRRKRSGVVGSGASVFQSLEDNPALQLAVLTLILFTLVGLTLHRMLSSSSSSSTTGGLDDDAAATAAVLKDKMKKVQFANDKNKKKRKKRIFDLGWGGIGKKDEDTSSLYHPPESMTDIGDKSREYLLLREEYDTKILPADPKRSLDFVKSVRKRTYSQIESTPYDVHNCPPNPPEGYPVQWPILDVLSHWSPDDVTPHDKIHLGLCIFDYATEQDKARRYREAEVPFVVRSDPAVARAAERWMHPGYMQRLLGDVKHRTEYSPNNHFMYWMSKEPMKKVRQKQKNKGNKEAPLANLDRTDEQLAYKEQMEKIDAVKKERQKLKEEGKDTSHLPKPKKHNPEGWNPPTEMLRMPYGEWIAHANVSDDSQLGPDNPHWYYRLIGCGTMGDGHCDVGNSEYLFDELTFFQPREKDSERSMYIVDPEAQKGIHCRFGMKGVIAENHFDGSRNAIALMGGERRYILSHPDQCENLALLPRDHPSARHSAVDWSDPDLDNFPQFRDAEVNEVVMQAGDILYLPTNWFHYIISLELNFQCNSRSGINKEYMEPIKECGF